MVNASLVTLLEWSLGPQESALRSVEMGRTLALLVAMMPIEIMAAPLIVRSKMDGFANQGARLLQIYAIETSPILFRSK